MLAKATEDKLEESVLPYFETLTQFLEGNGFQIQKEVPSKSISQKPSNSFQGAPENSAKITILQDEEKRGKER